MDALAAFGPATRSWFERAFAGPTPAQVAAWPAIATGAHVLVQAPTGSGKTLAAFLWALDDSDQLGANVRAALQSGRTAWLSSATVTTIDVVPEPVASPDSVIVWLPCKNDT